MGSPGSSGDEQYSNMKLELLVCLVACAVCVYGENCTTNNDCAGTMCGTTYHIVCEHADLQNGVVAGGGLCTCAKDDTSCTTRDDCIQIKDSINCMSDRRIHCYDNKCICSRW